MHLGLELVDAGVDLGVLVLHLAFELGDVGGDLGFHADHLLRLEGLALQELSEHGLHISLLIMRWLDPLTRALAKSILCSCFGSSFGRTARGPFLPERGRRSFRLVAFSEHDANKVEEVLEGR